MIATCDSHINILFGPLTKRSSSCVIRIGTVAGRVKGLLTATMKYRLSICDPETGIKRTSTQRFFDKVVRQTNGCWVWIGAKNQCGYGIFFPEVPTVDNKYELTHRWIYEHIFGPLTTQKPWVLHRCDNRPCVNPFHLYAGDAKDNARDVTIRGRRSYARRKLTVEQCRDVKGLLLSKMSIRKIASLLCIKPSTVRDIRLGKIYANVEVSLDNWEI